jgi:CRP/FNR family transcriptional regulator, cyclic AMP receptor protein
MTAGKLTLPDNMFSLTLLRAVASADHASVRAAARIAVYAPGDAIYRQGAASGALALLVEGRVKLSVPSAHGKELVVSLIEPGQSFGEIGFLDGQPRSLDATAISSSRVLLVRRTTLLEIMARTPALALAFAEATCKRLRRTTKAVQQAVFYGVEERLADCIVYLASSADRGAAGTEPTVIVWQHELAAMIGVTRESINKQLRAWQTSNLVSLRRGSIRLVDTAGLSRIAKSAAGASVVIQPTRPKPQKQTWRG